MGMTKLKDVTFKYLNADVMASIDPLEFRRQRPYPWINPRGFLTEDGIGELLHCMPDLSLFTPCFDQTRKYGQANHDRYVFEYEDGMELPESWQRFVGELRGDAYRRFICALLGIPTVGFRFQWHYTPTGGEVPPHCDSVEKIGTQIFYMNSNADWNPDWGGETRILDDEGRFRRESNPSIDDFPHQYPADISENRSLIFRRERNSWHGMRSINCPAGALRKVFIVVFEERRPLRKAVKKVGRLVRGKPLVTRNERLVY